MAKRARHGKAEQDGAGPDVVTHDILEGSTAFDHAGYVRDRFDANPIGHITEAEVRAVMGIGLKAFEETMRTDLTAFEKFFLRMRSPPLPGIILTDPIPQPMIDMRSRTATSPSKLVVHAYGLGFQVTFQRGFDEVPTHVAARDITAIVADAIMQLSLPTVVAFTVSVLRRRRSQAAPVHAGKVIAFRTYLRENLERGSADDVRLELAEIENHLRANRVLGNTRPHTFIVSRYFLAERKSGRYVAMTDVTAVFDAQWKKTRLPQSFFHEACRIPRVYRGWAGIDRDLEVELEHGTRVIGGPPRYAGMMPSGRARGATIAGVLNKTLPAVVDAIAPRALPSSHGGPSKDHPHAGARR